MSSTSEPVSLLSAARILSSRLRKFIKSDSNATNQAHRFEVPISMDPSQILPYLREHPIPQKLYFKSRNSSFQVAGFLFSCHEYGATFTEEVYIRITSILDQSKPNMRFYGGHRFDRTCSKHPHSHWGPYHGYTFVLPAVEIFCDSLCNVCLAVNFYHRTGFDYIFQLLSSISPPSLSDSLFTFRLPKALSCLPLTDFNTWNDKMSQILRDIASGKYEKIVLARQKQYIFLTECTPDPLHVLSALINQNTLSPFFSRRNNKHESDSYYLCIQVDYRKAFLSCTPERLFRYDGKQLFTEALAGTVRRAPIDEEKDVLAILFNEKNLKEHRFVVDYITDAISRCGFHSTTDGPHIRKLPHLVHLSTEITAKKSKYTQSEEINPLVFRLLSALHPTPAVCGFPMTSSLPHIETIEGFDRGFFAGPFGWISSAGAEFCVAIRSANIFDQYLTAYAGCGIVNGSESASEWDETELKLSSFNDLLSSPWTGLLQKDINYNLSLKNITSQSKQDIIEIGSYEANDGIVAKRNFQTEKDQHINKNSEVLSFQEILGNERLCENGFENIGFDTTALEKEPNINTLWGSCAVEELIRNKVFFFFISPGSRSAPLAVAVMRNGSARYIMAHDERGAAYMAVGYARATCFAAAVITSSGTAVANLLPAVVEAWMEELPIILLTADRPPELRDVGANQAICQPGIFGNYVVWSKDFPCPCEDVPISCLISDIDFAVYKSGTGCTFSSSNFNSNKGPVHLNFMFRENLSPEEQPWNAEYLRDLSNEWRYSDSPMTTYISQGNVCSYQIQSFSSRGISSQDKGVESLAEEMMKRKCGVILLGGGKSSTYRSDDKLCVHELSKILNWPIISDICGGLRLDASVEGVINNIDTLLLSSPFRHNFKPNCVLQFGEHVTSKRIQNWIKEGKKSTKNFIHALVTSTSKRIDEHFTVTHRLESNVYNLWNLFCRVNNLSTPKENKNGSDMRWFKELVCISSRVDAQMEILINEMRCNFSINEILCARTISECVGMGRVKSLYVGNSMPIRDLDMYGCKRSGRMDVRIVGNRGASGIDGVISSGIGFITGCPKDITIVLGDMSALHDLNALHCLRADGEITSMNHGRVTVLIVNNGGGGIFSMLPISKHPGLMSPMFDTKHSSKFDGVSQMFGIEHANVNSVVELKKHLTDSSETHKVIEVNVSDNHTLNVNIHRELSENIVTFMDHIFGK